MSNLDKMVFVNRRLITEAHPLILRWFNIFIDDNFTYERHPLISLMGCVHFLQLCKLPKKMDGMISFSLILIMWKSIHQTCCNANKLKSCTVTDFSVYQVESHWGIDYYTFSVSVSSQYATDTISMQAFPDKQGLGIWNYDFISIIQFIERINKSAGIILQDIFNGLQTYYAAKKSNKQREPACSEWLACLYHVLDNWWSYRQTIGPIRVKLCPELFQFDLLILNDISLNTTKFIDKITKRIFLQETPN